MEVIVIRSNEFKKELDQNGIGYTQDKVRFTLENSPKARMAIRMIKERFGSRTVKEI